MLRFINMRPTISENNIIYKTKHLLSASYALSAIFYMVLTAGMKPRLDTIF